MAFNFCKTAWFCKTSVVVSCVGAAFAGRAAAQTLPDRQPVERAQNLCDSYGQGFVRVAGTNTCVRIGGHVQVELGAGRPVEFDHASPLDTPQANLSSPTLVQGDGGAIPAGLRFDGPSGN